MKELYDQASAVACYFRVYSAYGGNPRTAVRALRRRMPGSTAEECDIAFHRALLLIDRCRKIVDDDYRSPPVQSVRRQRKNAPVSWEQRLDVSHLLPVARPDFPDFSDSTIESTLQFVLVYDHLR